MRPTTQPHQRSYRQDSWQPEASYPSARPTPASSAMHTGTTYVSLPPAAPALPPPRPPYHASAPTMSKVSSVSQPYAHSSQVPANLRPQQPLPHRLMNPYEQQEQSMASNAATTPYHPTRTNTTRLSFGPGDPLFSDHRASVAYPSPSAAQPPLSPRPYSTNDPALAHAITPPPRMTHRASSSSSARSGLPQHTADDRSKTSHGAPGHEFDDCPGCRAEMEDAIKASLQSAQQEDELRKRELREQQELDRIYAKTAEENELQRRLAQEEEQLLQKVLEDSRREAEVQSQRSTQDEALLLEESRQSALRQREQDARLEAEMLEAAKLASTTHEEQRRKELDAMHDAEKRALQLSLQEQEDEWARRESAERSLLEFLDHRGIDRSATPLSSAMHSASASTSQSSTSTTSMLQQASSSYAASSASNSNDLEAEYWRFAGHDEAYKLALQMQQASLTDAHHRQAEPGPSTSRMRRPLPQTPQFSAHSHGFGEHPTESTGKQDPRPTSSQPVTLHALDDAPPAYAEATQPGSCSNNPAMRYPEKASSSRYDAATLQDLSRPVLQHRSSSSSSGRSHLEGPLAPLSPGPSLAAAPNLASPSPTPSGSEESSPAPQAATASPSIPERGSSQKTPASKRSSVSASSIAPEQRGQRALAGIEFGYSGLPFAPNLDKSRLPSVQSATATASTSSSSTSVSSTKTLFPSSIELSSLTTKSTTDSASRFFVIRAHSWKSLLRAIAWYGNSRVEASPEEVAAASDRRSRCLLRAEVEFVTPTRVDLGYGVAEYARAAQSTGSMPKNPSPAHVALCLSLLPLSSAKSSSSGEASAWLKSDEYQVIKRESRRLDAYYAGRGSTRRLIQLARQPPALPVALVQVAQLLHASHTFSAACPSSGSTARHSPRDLHHAIERHDEGFVRKQKAMLAAGSALASQSNGLASTSSLASSNPRLSMQLPSRASSSTDLNRDADDDDDVDDDDEEHDFNDFSLLEHGLTADGSFDAQDKVLMGKRQRLKAKVKRRLAKRNSDGRVVDEDLATWITPFDLSQHG
ncbi:uncharacterized protein UTRI_01489 [Ustilago trichophora]|uniref:Uncharacterized protein n=1 Tax=Ustilago trichophora TaxID=86804 RepID=A0A5C3DZV3_9BASI|nr:uncharacterized protein UTRI_01489 [Ustilago trichophora]